MIYLYVDKTAIERNAADGGNRPPLVVVRDGEEMNCFRVKIIGECELIYDPLASPVSGATVFLKVSAFSKVEISNP